MSRHVRTFEPQFAPLVEQGLKLCTIRQKPKRMIRPGDALSLRTWTGRPYGSKQRVLRETVCERCVPVVVISKSHIRVDGVMLNCVAREGLAQADGFEDSAAMFAFFEKKYELPLVGVLITWPALARVSE